MFQDLEEINRRPRPFEFYTASELWTDEHTSKHMLATHLDGETDLASRKTVFIDRSVEWIVSRFGVSSETRIADFGCGPGLYASRLARTGAQVTGIDFSPRSIRYAREQADKSGLSIRYVNENYLDYQTDDRFDLVLMSRRALDVFLANREAHLFLQGHILSKVGDNPLVVLVWRQTVQIIHRLLLHACQAQGCAANSK